MIKNDIKSDLLLHIVNLSKSYNNSKKSENQKILQEIDFNIYKNDFLCILGPSGCGKTTFLRCIAGFEQYSGEITIENSIVTSPNTDRILVFQDFNQLFPWKTVEKNIQYPLRKKGIKNKYELNTLSNKYLEMVGLSKYKDFYPHQLSGGMKQRVAIAKSLAINPKVILMDEPFASLDAITRKNLQQELINIKEKEKITIIFVTHNIQEALVLGTRIAVMSKKGDFKIDIENPLQKPVTPNTYRYSDYWNILSKALES